MMRSPAAPSGSFYIVQLHDVRATVTPEVSSERSSRTKHTDRYSSTKTFRMRCSERMPVSAASWRQRESW
jgi:hypothetical protein